MTPVKVAMLCVALNFVLNITLIWTPLRTSGLAWSTALCAIVQVSMLMVLIRKHVTVSIDREVLRSWLLTAVLTLIMGVAVAVVVHLTWVDGSNWLQSLWVVVCAVIVGVGVMGIGSVLLKRPELYWVLGRQR